MYYLEIQDDRGNWSNEVGDYNDFETIKECKEIIHEFENEVMNRSNQGEFYFSWRILQNNGEIVDRVNNLRRSQGNEHIPLQRMR